MSDENPGPDQLEKLPDDLPESQRAGSSPTTQTPTQTSADEFREVQKELSGYERSTLTLTKVIVAVNMLTLLFIGLQWHEMKSGSADTHALAVAAKTQSEKMSNMSDAADKIRQAAENMVIQDQRIADNAQQALTASNAQSKAALDASISASQSDQRAWIGIADITSQQFNETAFKFVVALFNSGKTPGRNVQISASFLLSPVAVPEPPQDQIKSLEFHPMQSIAPQGKFSAVLGIAPIGEPSSAIQIQGLQILTSRFQDIKTKKVILYLFGMIKYDDIFSNRGTTEYCASLIPETNEMAFCHGFNAIN